MPDAPLRCLFLGDSYTAGTAVPEKLRWPVQLTAQIRTLGRAAEAPRFIAGNGWTTEDLLTAMDEENPLPRFDLVFLMIGVNNQFHGRPFAQFQTQFRLLLDRAIGLAQGRPSQVLVLAIPDYSVTPFAADRIPAAIASDIDRYNNECRAIAKSCGVEFLDTAEISRQAGVRKELLVADGLHPSEEMYRLWSEFIFDTIKLRF